MAPKASPSTSNEAVASTTIPISPEARDELRVRCAKAGGLSYDEYLREELSLGE